MLLYRPREILTVKGESHPMSYRHLLAYALALVVTLSSTTSWGAGLSVSSAGKGVFILQGSAMDTVSGMDVTLSYDPSLLSGPTVTQGSLISGAMMAANTNISGGIKLAVVSTKPFAGSGPIATISFSTYKEGGAITIANSSLINASGAAVASQTSQGTQTSGQGLIATPGIPFSVAMTVADAPKENVEQTPAKETASATIATPEQSKAPELPAPSAPEPTPPTKQQGAAVESDNETIETVIASVLDQFSDYSGKPDLDAYKKLFDRPFLPIQQIPKIAITDGTSTIKVVLPINSEGHSPGVSIGNGKLISLKREGKQWSVEIAPVRNSLYTTLYLSMGNEMTVIPLTVAPPLPLLAPDEEEFRKLLQQGESIPDVSGDEVSTYVDDYIYTANYLVTFQGRTAP